MPKISIVMPVYNGERYLREAIESILNQTYQDWELIFVNDCSTDKSLSIMEEYARKDGRIKIISNQTNQKLPRSLNIGFNNAVGEFLTWTSDDNRYKPQALELLLDFLQRKSNVGLVYADMDYIDDEGKKTGSVSKEAKELYYNDCVGACFMYRNSIISSVGEYDPDMFLVEDYEYWLRISKLHKVEHLPVCLYEYRYHEGSLTQTRVDQINKQLYNLRLKELDFLLERIEGKEKEYLFIDMWTQNPKDFSILKNKFFDSGELPESIRWIERDASMDDNKLVILFGAGMFGKKALDYLGAEKVAFYVDNNAELVGSVVNGKKVISFEVLKQIYKDFQVVIAVDARKASILAKQLEEAGIVEYITYLELVNNLKKPSSSNQAIEWIEVCKKAKKWIINNSVKNKGIINNTGLPEAYPEVTGYYIPTLMNWGLRDLAVSFARWLCSIQHEDGAWYDTEGKNPYVFDSAQILKGLLAVRGAEKGLDEIIKRGCDWIITNINDEGRLTTPSQDEWGEDGVCSELIHLYCVSPLIEAADVYGIEKYRDAANKVVSYYINNHKDEIMNFGFLSHFYAYVMEALCDVGETELAREAMKKIADLQKGDGMIPAYKDVEWVCSTAMFQFAIVWYKLGDLEHGNKALEYAARLQNETGGWYGSYATVENPKATDVIHYPNYFATSEISWAVKYFFDAVYYKCRLEFEVQAPIFKNEVDKEDGRYNVILEEILNFNPKRVCDVGCGKGRYLKNLMEDTEVSQFYAVDLSNNVMATLDSRIEKKQGSLTNIPFEDETFDLVYTVEALEHSIFPEEAIKELLRVIKKNGKVVIIDKNKSALGLLEIDEWEQWFEDEMFQTLSESMQLELRIINNISYEDGIADGLFNAWIINK